MCKESFVMCKVSLADGTTLDNITFDGDYVRRGPIVDTPHPTCSLTWTTFLSLLMCFYLVWDNSTIALQGARRFDYNI